MYITCIRCAVLARLGQTGSVKKTMRIYAAIRLQSIMLKCLATYYAFEHCSKIYPLCSIICSYYIKYAYKF